MSFKVVSTATFEPGAPNRNHSGPMHSPGLWDNLQLPNGSTVGQTPNEQLRAIFHKVGIAESHTAGREVLCQQYGELLNRIGMDGYNAALSAFLQKHRG